MDLIHHTRIYISCRDNSTLRCLFVSPKVPCSAHVDNISQASRCCDLQAGSRLTLKSGSGDMSSCIFCGGGQPASKGRHQWEQVHPSPHPWVPWDGHAQNGANLLMATCRSRCHAGTFPVNQRGATQAQLSCQMGHQKPTFLLRTDIFCCMKMEDWKGAFPSTQQSFIGSQKEDTPFCYDCGYLQLPIQMGLVIYWVHQ